MKKLSILQNAYVSDKYLSSAMETMKSCFEYITPIRKQSTSTIPAPTKGHTLTLIQTFLHLSRTSARKVWRWLSPAHHRGRENASSLQPERRQKKIRKSSSSLYAHADTQKQDSTSMSAILPHIKYTRTHTHIRIVCLHASYMHACMDMCYMQAGMQYSCVSTRCGYSLF